MFAYIWVNWFVWKARTSIEFIFCW